MEYHIAMKSNYTIHKDFNTSHKLSAVQKQSDIKECTLYDFF